MNRPSIRHVVWDWNGTLLADQSAVLDALNVMLADLGHPTTDMATYRRLYTRPVRRFYERLLARDIDDELWARIDVSFHDAYFEVVRRVDLDAHARIALDQVSATGRTQSLLSMAPHDHLVAMVDHHDLGHHFDRVDGIRGVGGGHKAGWLRDHLERLSVADAAEVVLIGDALDDATAARALGAEVVLYDGGAHPTEHLVDTGAHVVPTLLDALDAAGIATGRPGGGESFVDMGPRR